MNARAGGDRRAGELAYIAHRMQLAVVLVDRRALAAYHSHPHVLSSEALGAGLDLVPLFIVARDLVRSIPGEIALDLVFANERAHERLVSFGEPPDAGHSFRRSVGTPRRSSPRRPRARSLRSARSLPLRWSAPREGSSRHPRARGDRPSRPRRSLHRRSRRRRWRLRGWVRTARPLTRRAKCSSLRLLCASRFRRVL